MSQERSDSACSSVPLDPIVGRDWRAMKTLHVATSPLTARIYAGTVLKDGQTWGANKRDVTGEACAAVAHHALSNGGTITVTANGTPAYEITVRELTPNDQASGAPVRITIGAGEARNVW